MIATRIKNAWRRCFVAAWAVALTLAATSHASGDAPTLMQWGYGDGGDGGPNLDEPLVTDRPDFTEASSTVGRGVVQIEAGYTYVADTSDTSSVVSHSFPETLYRIGMLADWFELRLGWNWGIETVNEFGVGRTTASGSQDLYLGIKWGLTGQEGLLPELAVMTELTVPTGSGEFSAGEALPGFVWLYGWDINDWLATGGLTRISRQLDDLTDEPFSQISQSWTVNYKLTDSLGMYTECFAIIPDGADTNPTQSYADGGFTYLVTNNLQLDIRAGVGLNEAADDYFTGSGFAVRF